MAFDISSGFFGLPIVLDATQDSGSNQPGLIAKNLIINNIIAANGSDRASTQIEIPANAIVDEYLLKVTAKRANFVNAALAGEVRQGPSSKEIIIDFGKMVTINKIRSIIPDLSFKAYAWMGSKFDTLNDIVPTAKASNYELGLLANALLPQFKDTATPNSSTKRNLVIRNRQPIIYPFSKETRTERLLLQFNHDIDFQDLTSSLELSLPDLPSDLTISINGEPPVWNYPGMVKPGIEKETSESGWNKDSEILVSLAEPLRAFTGQATNKELIPLTIELTSQTPGAINIKPHKSSFRYLHRMSFNKDTELNANFEMEGQIDIELAVPPPIDLSKKMVSKPLGVRLELSADLPPERAIPAVGPPPNSVSELVLGKGRAACVRLANTGELGRITAIRLPLSTPGSRAETRISLWRGDANNAIEVIPEAVSLPQSWSGAQEQWLRFDLPEPLEIEPGQNYWMALLVETGEVCWKLADGTGEGNDNTVRLGAPSGPWRALPKIFGQGALAVVSARLHVLGLTREDTPMAPVQISLGEGAPRDINPTKDGITLELENPDTGSKALSKTGLSLTSRTSGTLTLNNVDLITEDVDYGRRRT